MSREGKGDLIAILVIAAFVILGPAVFRWTAPCSWMGWLRHKDVPVRCLPGFTP